MNDRPRSGRALPANTRIRDFERAQDEGPLRACVIELQEFERQFDPRMPPGEEIADEYAAPRPEVAESSGFSLHAGIAAKASQRDKIERLARYVSRPPVATERLSLTRGGNVRYALKTPYRDGIT